MSVIAVVYLLALGTGVGWFGRMAYDLERKRRALAQMLKRVTPRVERRSEPVREIVEYSDPTFFSGAPKITLLPSDFDDRA